MSNLAWACSYCNAHKGPNVAGIDPGTGAVTPLFNPRAQRWEDHFVWSQASAVGITPVGRTTIAILAINHPLLLKQRAELIAEGVFGS